MYWRTANYRENKVIIKHLAGRWVVQSASHQVARQRDSVKQKCSQCFPPLPLTFYYNLLSQSRGNFPQESFVSFQNVPRWKIFLNHCLVWMVSKAFSMFPDVGISTLLFSPEFWHLFISLAQRNLTECLLLSSGLELVIVNTLSLTSSHEHQRGEITSLGSHPLSRPPLNTVNTNTHTSH